MSTINSLLLIWILTNGIFVSRNGKLGYWDEALTLFFLLYYVVLVKKKRKITDKANKRMLICVVSTALIGILGNLIFQYAASYEAIIRDIVGFIKFPLVYLIICETSIQRKLFKSAKKLNSVLKIYSVMLFLFGILSMFTNLGMSQTEYRYGLHPYMFLYGHPTGLVMALVLMIAIMASIEVNNEFRLYYIFNALTLILTFRTKGIAIAALFLFIKYSSKWYRRFKILFWIGASAIVFVVLYSKLSLYMTFSSSGRQSLYSGALLLARSCFPVGSGFATYASHVSGNFYSKVYNFIHIPEVNFSTSEFAIHILGDVGYPYYLGQFGFLGFVLFIRILWDQLRISIGSKKKKIPMNLGMFVIITYCFIGLTAESTLLNFGVELATMLAICRYKNLYNNLGSLETNPQNRR